MKQDKLKALREIISKNEVENISIKTSLFGGADISIVSKKPVSKDGFYGNPQFVETKYSKELSWLIFQLKEIFKDELDYLNKYPFYGRLAEKANKSIELNGDNLSKLLNDVLDEAEEINKKIR